MACSEGVFLLALIAVGVGQDVSDVVELVNSNFSKHTKEYKYVLVSFYAPWCGHCQKLVPEYDRAAAVLKTRRRVSLAKVDATEEKELARKYNVKSFPSLVWFEDGVETEFDAAKTSDGIIAWVDSMTGPAVIQTSRPPELRKEKPQVVLHAPSLLPGFEAAAKAHRRKASWFYVPDFRTDTATVQMLHIGEEPLTLTDGADDKDKVANFVTSNVLPLFGKMEGDTFDKYMEAKNGIIWSLFPADGEDFEAVHKKYRPMMSEVATKVRSRFFVTITDTVQFAEAIDNMLSVTQFPAIAVQKKAGDKRTYVYQGEMTAQKILGFIENVEADRVQPNLKTQPEPTADDDGVKIFVGSTLQKELFHPTKDVLLEVYAPWCGHCKKLDPEYNKLAKKIIREEFTDLLVIAKIDGIANDSPIDSVDWTSFPTIYFAKAGTNEATVYDGERTANGIWKYIRKHATNAKEILERIERRKTMGKKAEEL